MADIWTGTRRGLLGRGAALAGAAGLAGAGPRTAPALARARRRPPIDTIVVDCQENRSFDHYYGFAPFVGRHGVPAGYTQPDGTAGPSKPSTSRASRPTTSATRGLPSTPSGTAGAMDGFYTTDGIDCMGYYTRDGAAVLLQPARRLHALRELLLLGARADLARTASTSPRARPAASRPTASGATACSTTRCILDLLDAAGVTWKVYNLGLVDSVPFGEYRQRLSCSARTSRSDARARASQGDYLHDARHGTLPKVSFMIPSFALRLGRASAGRRLGRDAAPEADDQALQDRTAVAPLGVHPHLRRARRVLRPRRAAAGRRLRARDPRADVGDLTATQSPATSRRPCSSTRPL